MVLYHEEPLKPISHIFCAIIDTQIITDAFNIFNLKLTIVSYRAFHRFRQAKFPDGGSVLGSSQLSILP
jgi:hypothetical protein